MKEINNCPSTLSPGFDTYSPTALKRLFNGKKVSHIIDFSYDEEENTADVVDNTTRISVGTPANFRGKKIIYPNIFIKRNKKKGKSDTP